jgi:thiol-disulfide isomerase/thioredoxin
MISSDTFQTVLIAAAILILVFTIYYIYSIHSSSNKLEKFTNVSKKGIEVIYIYSSTCPYCEKFDPVFAEFSKKVSTLTEFSQHSITTSKFEKSDADAKYLQHIDGYPAVLIYKEGQFLAKSIGYKDSESFEAFLKSLIEK